VWQPVQIEARDRKRLEQLCRHLARPALSDERAQCNVAGPVELKLKTPWRDGAAHSVMSTLELVQRLAALVQELPVTALRRSISAIGRPAWVGCRQLGDKAGRRLSDPLPTPGPVVPNGKFIFDCRPKCARPKFSDRLRIGVAYEAPRSPRCIRRTIHSIRLWRRWASTPARLDRQP